MRWGRFRHSLQHASVSPSGIAAWFLGLCLGLLGLSTVPGTVQGQIESSAYLAKVGPTPLRFLPERRLVAKANAASTTDGSTKPNPDPHSKPTDSPSTGNPKSDTASASSSSSTSGSASAPYANPKPAGEVSKSNPEPTPAPAPAPPTDASSSGTNALPPLVIASTSPQPKPIDPAGVVFGSPGASGMTAQMLVHFFQDQATPTPPTGTPANPGTGVGVWLPVQFIPPQPPSPAPSSSATYEVTSPKEAK